MIGRNKAVSLAVISVIVIAPVIIVGFGIFPWSSLRSNDNGVVTNSTSTSEGLGTSSYQSTSSDSTFYTPVNYQVINSNLTVYYGTACIVVELFQLSCPTMDMATHSPSQSNVELVSSEGIYYYAINFTFYLSGQPISHTVWFTNSTVFCVSPQYDSYNTCPGQIQSSEVFAIPISANSSISSSTGLRLELNLSMDPSTGLIVGLGEYNTLTSPNNVTTANLWPIPVDDLAIQAPTYCNYKIMMGYAIYKGNYELNNYTLGNPLKLSPPNVQINCPSPNPPSYFLFNPSSNIASISSTSSFPSTASKSLAISEMSNVAGYWMGSTNSPLFNLFPQDIYTVIAVNEWGQIAILHFAVT